MSGGPPTPPTRGRPRRDTVAARGRALLDVAARLFLEHGYGATTLEAVVQQAGISKRTLYQRYPDKAALFAAALEHIVQPLKPPSDVPLVLGDSLDIILERLAGFMLHAALQPSAVALHRLLVAESARFPEIGRMLAASGTVQLGTSLVAGVLTAAAEGKPLGGRLESAKDPLPPSAPPPPFLPSQPAGVGMSAESAQFLAVQFLNLVVSHPQAAASGLVPPLSAHQLADWPRACVALFLHGARGTGSLA